MPVTQHFCALFALLIPATAYADPVQPWVSPGARLSRVSMDAAKEDGHYKIPDDLVLVGASLEGGLVVFPTLLVSIGVEYNLTLDRSPDPPNGSIAFVGLDIPARVRFLGLGSDRGRFYGMVGVGYAVLWDRTVQLGAGTHDPATSDRSPLRSAGPLFEVGACYRFHLSDQVQLEAGIAPRMQITSASNGAGYYESAYFTQLSTTVYVSLPVSL